MQELHRQIASTQKENDVILLCPDDADCTPADAFDYDEVLRDSSNDSNDSVYRAPNTPKGKDFFRSDDGVFSHPKDEDPSYSPVGVDGMDWGRVYFWHRSLAWSEDGDEEAEEEYYDEDNN